MVAATNGSKVRIEYTGTFDDGSVFDTSAGKDPLEFTLGEHKVIPGFEDAIIGMSEGEEKDIVLAPDQAYGPVRPELIQSVSRVALKDLTPEVGMVLGLQMPGIPQPIPARIIKVEEEAITIDINPPLAGKTLHFHLKLMACS